MIRALMALLLCSVAATLGLAFPLTSGSSATAASAPVVQIVGMRRLTEAQYRNSIADVFGADIKVAGRFEPIVRPAHELIAASARDASISPSGFEQFDAIARGVAAQVFEESRRLQFMPCTPVRSDARDDACAAQVIAPMGRLLFRRPLTFDEQRFFVRLAGEAAAPAASFHKGLQLALASMLSDPRFLYIIETAEPDPAAAGGMRLDNWSRASRLSFTLWNATPSEALLKAAERGVLTDQAQLNAIVKSMVASPRFEAGLRAFFSDMLIFEKFDELAKDPVIYPYFNPQIAQDMPEQILRTISGHLLAQNGDYRSLFTTRRTYMTRALGALYQVPVSRSQGWVPYDFAGNDPRAGLLGQAGFLALYSHSGRSSPTLRGKAVREILMCQPVPPPPGNVNFTAVQDDGNKAMPTARIRLDAHNTDPVCSGCHKITDPIGLSMEKFDGIGAFRQLENGSEIDTSGSVDGTEFVGADGLGKALAASPDTTICAASRALEYATGRSSQQSEDLVEKLEGSFAESQYAIRALFLAVMTDPQTWHISLEQENSDGA